MRIKYVKDLAAIILLAVVAGCFPPPSPHLPRDLSNPLKRVAILPMKNDTDDVDGPEMMPKKNGAGIGSQVLCSERPEGNGQDPARPDGIRSAGSLV